jgi:hypothetical protein
MGQGKEEIIETSLGKRFNDQKIKLKNRVSDD